MVFVEGIYSSIFWTALSLWMVQLHFPHNSQCERTFAHSKYKVWSPEVCDLGHTFFSISETGSDRTSRGLRWLTIAFLYVISSPESFCTSSIYRSNHCHTMMDGAAWAWTGNSGVVANIQTWGGERGRRGEVIKTIRWTRGMHPGFSLAYVSRPGKVRALFILASISLLSAPAE